MDFLNNYTSLIHGHANPEIISVATEQIKKGASFAAPSISQYNLAEIICERVRSIDQIRFCNSGTEATMNAIRAARIVTGRMKIVKMEGGYHGTHDLAEISVNPSLESAGNIENPKSVPKSKGISAGVIEDVIVVPFNHKGICERIIKEHCETIACVIVEPMLGAAGCIPPEEGYLELLRKLTSELGIVLIFDEVVTFRLGQAGAQGIYGIDPDLTTFGKIIGGGFPVGAFGGQKDIMKIFSPREKNFNSHSGTFNGNPVTMEAGIACLKQLNPLVFERINALGEMLRECITKAFERVGIQGKVTGLGSLSHIHINSEKWIRDYRSAAKGNIQAMSLIHLELLEKGINIPPRGGECCISTPMENSEIYTFAAAFEESLRNIRPFIELTSPELIV